MLFVVLMCVVCGDVCRHTVSHCCVWGGLCCVVCVVCVDVCRYTVTHCWNATH